MLALHADGALTDAAQSRRDRVPGRLGHEGADHRRADARWLRAAHETSQWTTSVCTGSLVLGAAGILEGLEATTHWLVLDALAKYGATPVSRRVVEQGKVITAAGVSSGIDMALTLAAHIAGDELAQAHPARDRVRPRAAVRLRLDREGAARDRRAGQGASALSSPDRSPAAARDLTARRARAARPRCTTSSPRTKKWSTPWPPAYANPSSASDRTLKSPPRTIGSELVHDAHRRRRELAPGAGLPACAGCRSTGPRTLTPCTQRRSGRTPSRRAPMLGDPAGGAPHQDRVAAAAV